MTETGPATVRDIKHILANPIYAINLSPDYAHHRENIKTSTSDWIDANVGVIDEIGAKPYAELLLDVLKGHWANLGPDEDSWTEDEMRRVTVNPAYAINVYHDLLIPHPLALSEELWVGCATRLINEEGPIDFLTTLLEVLQGDYPRNPS